MSKRMEVAGQIITNGINETYEFLSENVKVRDRFEEKAQIVRVLKIMYKAKHLRMWFGFILVIGFGCGILTH
jgi:hypothetical protein